MSNRNRGHPHPPPPPHAALSPPIHDPIFAMRGGGGGHPPHPSLLEDYRDSQLGLGHRPLHLHPAAVIEERLAVQHGEIQGLLGDNQRFAATHVALKQELEAAQHELQRMAHFKDSLRADTEVRMRELYEKAGKLEAELRGAEVARAELQQIHGDVKELTAVRQDLSGQVQAMTQDLTRMTADLKQMPALRADVDAMKQELQRARAAIEYEKKGFTENYEHGQVMEKKLIAMAREMEKLRAEIANAEKRSRATAAAAAAAGNPGQGYNANYGNAETGYAGNPYPAYYGMNQVQPGVENFQQYAAAPGPGPAAWGAYDMQRAQGHR
ncbi:protein FLX [Trifolium repens]|nr:protein FLX [Trifolium repens]